MKACVSRVHSRWYVFSAKSMDEGDDREIRVSERVDLIEGDWSESSWMRRIVRGGALRKVKIKRGQGLDLGGNANEENEKRDE